MSTAVDIEDILRDELLSHSSPDEKVPNLSSQWVKDFRAELLSWYYGNRRMMPWRGDQTDIPVTAYSVWVSEVMLQQTRVETVIEYWNRWMRAFPSLQTLAQASPEEVNRLWAGLGYYRRAQNLLAGAKYVMENFAGEVPSTKQDLLQIPGIGPYTAGAISSIAFARCEPVVDGNVLRVFSRIFASKLPVGSGKLEKLSWALAAILVDPMSPASFNQAIMELGATICKPTSPSCGTCPVRFFCKARTLVDFLSTTSAVDVTSKLKSLSTDPTTPAVEEIYRHIPNSITSYPRKIEKKRVKDIFLLVYVLRCRSFNGIIGAEDKYLFIRRPEKGLLANQWEFPNISINDMDITENDAGEIIEGNANKVLVLNEKLVEDIKSFFLQRCNAQWLSDDDQKMKDSTSNLTSVKRSAIFANMFFQRISQPKLIGGPILHIFSHERHTMQIMVEDVMTVCDTVLPTDLVQSRWSWMTVTEIREQGITTGCKKILNEVVGLNERQRKTTKSRENFQQIENKTIVVDLTESDEDRKRNSNLDAFSLMKDASARSINKKNSVRKRKATE